LLGALSLLRLLLAPLALLWWLVSKTRAITFRLGWRKQFHPAGPTVSIGNISAGGTGKTPFLFWVLAELEKRAVRCGVLSRGYGGDEGRMLESRFPHVALAEGADRVAGMRRLAALGADVAPEVYLLDDGFQHLRVARDFDIVLIDATRPFGFCLPTGLFRESAGALKRAQVIVVTRATQRSDSARASIWQKIDSVTGQTQPRIEGDVFLSAITPLDGGEAIPEESIRDKKVRLAAGIGNPASFLALMESAGAEVESTHWLKDHAVWADADTQIFDGETPTMVTEKDAVKLRGRSLGNVFEVRVDWRFTKGAEAIDKMLDDVVLPVRASKIEPLWAAIDPEGDAC